jgi:hypothetical protein
MLALMHGGIMWAWTDWAGHDYRAGFLLGAAVQAVCTYYGSKTWVFKVSA